MNKKLHGKKVISFENFKMYEENITVFSPLCFYWFTVAFFSEWNWIAKETHLVINQIMNEGVKTYSAVARIINLSWKQTGKLL